MNYLVSGGAGVHWSDVASTPWNRRANRYSVLMAVVGLLTVVCIMTGCSNTQLRVPDQNRFSKKKLAGGLNEPTELTVLPDLSILIAERKGDIEFYNAATGELSTVAHLEVYDHTDKPNVNVETGLLGIKADPRYAQNHWIYVYYSPVGEPVDRLSRFRFRNNRFDKESEQIILEVPTDRDICCHTGGSIAFDAAGNLYLSTGDNTTPFDEINPETGKPYPINTHGYAPLDDRPGFEQYDDGRAAGNTNDLRGKILRIKVNSDGSYSIPEGNLFPPGTPGTKPEIYVMGNRNPYRISVDQHTGYLYWGEVGPDANNDSLKTRGPRGYDEINQAREAGNFGWPFFIADNIPYRHYNYATGESGPPYDPEHPVNDSRNNDGLEQLPPAQPAFIWYPYDKSGEFPILGSGGRTSMAGPVYYTADFPEESRYPGYYNGKLFMYDWIRNWIMVVTMNEQGDLLTIEPFMEQTVFYNISDLETGPDGRFYEVEYGTGWFTKNSNSGLYVIEYNGGNRPPKVVLNARKTSGAVPFTVHLSAAGTEDPDGDPLSYIWDLGNGVEKTTDTPGVDYEYTRAGKYAVTLTVRDGNGGETTGSALPVYAGNERPEVTIDIRSNKTFYFPGQPVAYRVHVTDPEDGRSGQPGFDTTRVNVRTEYLETPDEALLQTGHPEAMISGMAGKAFMQASDCQSCHQMDAASIGPSFRQVAAKYEDDSGATDYLVQKIIEGGSGVWGETAMAAHPGLPESEVRQIAAWILSLTEESGSGLSMPMAGTFDPSQRSGLTDEGALLLTASYTDKGANGVPPLAGTGRVVLRNPFLQAAAADTSFRFSRFSMGERAFQILGEQRAWLKFSDISLQDVRRIKVRYALGNESGYGWKLSVHLDEPGGKLLGGTTLRSDVQVRTPAAVTFELSGQPDARLHDVYFLLEKPAEIQPNEVALIGFELYADS